MTTDVSVNHVSDLFLDKHLQDAPLCQSSKPGRPIGLDEQQSTDRRAAPTSSGASAQHFGANPDTPVSEYFNVIDTRDRRVGIGRMINLLQVMETPVRKHSVDLSAPEDATEWGLNSIRRVPCWDGTKGLRLAHETDNTPLDDDRGDVEMPREAHGTVAGLTLAPHQTRGAKSRRHRNDSPVNGRGVVHQVRGGTTVEGTREPRTPDNKGLQPMPRALKRCSPERPGHRQPTSGQQRINRFDQPSRNPSAAPPTSQAHAAGAQAARQIEQAPSPTARYAVYGSHRNQRQERQSGDGNIRRRHRIRNSGCWGRP
ncbi:MAG: hypothetical protein P8Y78_10705 [Acidihalobacter sp.]